MSLFQLMHLIILVTDHTDQSYTFHKYSNFTPSISLENIRSWDDIAGQEILRLTTAVCSMNDVFQGLRILSPEKMVEIFEKGLCGTLKLIKDPTAYSICYPCQL